MAAKMGLCTAEWALSGFLILLSSKSGSVATTMFSPLSFHTKM